MEPEGSLLCSQNFIIELPPKTKSRKQVTTFLFLTNYVTDRLTNERTKEKMNDKAKERKKEPTNQPTNSMEQNHSWEANRNIASEQITRI